MRERKFTHEQIKTLLKNKFVRKCSKTTISFSADFKLLAVKKYEEGLTTSQIFEEAGFPPALIGEHVSEDRLSDWRRIFKI